MSFEYSIFKSDIADEDKLLDFSIALLMPKTLMYVHLSFLKSELISLPRVSLSEVTSRISSVI